MRRSARRSAPAGPATWPGRRSPSANSELGCGRRGAPSGMRAVENWDPAMFGQHYAKTYDALTRRTDTEATAAFLCELAADGPVLELAVGTGRIAIPLAATGLHVDGLDISPEMAEQLRAKPGGERVEVTIGDLADAPVDGEYRLIFVVFISLWNAANQDDQIRCFQNVARHLVEDGMFVVETLVPDLDQYGGGYVDTEDVAVDHVWLDILTHDAVEQR